MNLRDLKYLIALVDHCHFGKAATACFVSQPTLSMQIKKLEKSLGVQLIERTNKSFLVTETGKVIAEQARKILIQVKHLNDYAKSSCDPFQGDIQIGIIPTLAPYLLPHIISGLTKKFPKLNLYLIEDKTDNLIESLKKGKIEAAILALPLLEDDFCALPLFEEDFVLAVSKNHTLSKKKSITDNDLKNQTLLLLEEGHCFRDHALSVCRQLKANEINHFKATSLETLRHMVAANVGMTLMPKLSTSNDTDIHYLSFKNSKPKRIIGMTWRSLNAKQMLFEAIVNEIRKLMRKNKDVKIMDSSVYCGKSTTFKTNEEIL